MRYPMIRRNTDGTEIVVHNHAEAYANPETIAGFCPDKPIPETPAPEVEANPEATRTAPKRGR